MSRSYTLGELADLVGGKVEGDKDLSIAALNGLQHAEPGEITFIQQKKQIPLLAECRASACIVPEHSADIPMSTIVVGRPDVAAARIHNALLQVPFTATGIHPSAVIGKECIVDDQVSIGPLVCIGDRVRIGARVTIDPGVVIGDDSIIGEGTIIHSNVSVAKGCTIGKRVILYHGVVIGSDGFGFATDDQGCHTKKPQVGTVRIDDDVEIGANSCVDRAAFGETRIKAGTKIDNLVQVGHNVEVGVNSILVAQVGVAGSTSLGRNVVLGAKAGIAGHLHLDDGVMVAAMSGVHNNQPKGAVIGGAPAFAVKEWGKATAAYRRLPQMVKEVRRLKKVADRITGLQEDPENQERDE